MHAGGVADLNEILVVVETSHTRGAPYYPNRYLASAKLASPHSLAPSPSNSLKTFLPLSAFSLHTLPFLPTFSSVMLLSAIRVFSSA
jgi:hypothetical protein